jgi:hypothetical protein
VPFGPFKRACSCGSKLDLKVKPGIASFLRFAWERVHSGPDHQPVGPDDKASTLDHKLEEISDLMEAAGLGRPS